MPATQTAPPGQLRVAQPPTTIWPDGPGGKPLDITGMNPKQRYRAITKRDRDIWGYARVAAEAGRSVQRVRRWVMVARALQAGGEADDKAFVVPDGYVGDSPWWYACNARSALRQMGAMDEEGVSVRYRPAGRKRGAVDRVPRRRRENTPAADQAPEILAAYQNLTGGPGALSDRKARAELSDRYGLTRLQLAYRLKAATRPETPEEHDNAKLRQRYRRRVRALIKTGMSPYRADITARDELVAETGLTRRALAGRIVAASAKPARKPARKTAA